MVKIFIEKSDVRYAFEADINYLEQLGMSHNDLSLFI